MRIFLVRHGQTYSNRDGILQGQIDTELSELGIQQAENVAERLKNHSFTKVFSSDLQRASNTAKHIVKHHNIEIIYDERLREKHFGDFGGKKRSEVDLSSLENDFENSAPPNGESWNQVVQRVKSFVDDLEGEGDIVFVSHGGTMRALLHIFLDRDLKDLVLNEIPKNTCIYIIEKKEDKYVLTLENCDIHNS